MQRVFPVALISFSLALISACDPDGNPSQPNTANASATRSQPAPSNVTSQQRPGQKPEWISLKAGICKFDRMDQASSEFEFTCPVAINRFVWGGMKAGKGIQMTAGNFNNSGPVDLSFEKSPDGYHVMGYAWAKDVAITIELTDGRLETLQIRNEVPADGTAHRRSATNTGAVDCTSEFINDYGAVAFEMTMISKFKRQDSLDRAKSYCEQFFKKHSGVRCKAKIKREKDLDYKEGFLSADDLQHNCDVVAQAS